MSKRSKEVEGLAAEEGSLRPVIELGSPVTNPVLTPELKTVKLQLKCWELILTNLDSKSFLSAINSVPEWSQVMKPHKTTVLFPMVVPILEKFISTPSLLACRQTTKATNVNVLKQLKAKPSAGEMEHSSSNLTEVRRKYVFLNPETIEQFVGVMGQRPFPAADPFLSSSVTFIVGEDLGLARQSILTMLSLYGFHIKDATFEAPLNALHAEGVTLESLAYLANLKSLHIKCGLSNELQEFRASVYLPPLPKLIELHIGSSSGVDITLDGKSDSNEVSFGLRLLRAYGGQLRSVSIGWLLGEPSIDGELLNSLLPRLRFLQVEHVHDYVLRKLLGVTWKLEELIFGSWTRPRFCEWKSKQMIKVVNHFSQTLVSLGLILGRGDNDWGFKDSVLLPVSLDLTTPLPKLNCQLWRLDGSGTFWKGVAKKLKSFV